MKKTVSRNVGNSPILNDISQRFENFFKHQFLFLEKFQKPYLIIYTRRKYASIFHVHSSHWLHRLMTLELF